MMATDTYIVEGHLQHILREAKKFVEMEEEIGTAILESVANIEVLCRLVRENIENKLVEQYT